MKTNISSANQPYDKSKGQGLYNGVSGYNDDGYDQYYNGYYYYYYDDLEDESTADPLDVVSISLCLLGILANSVSIFIITRRYRRLTTYLKLVINLCLSDALILVPTVSGNIVKMIQYVNLCFNLASRLITDLALLLTLLNLFGIAIDHYLAIMKPLLYRKEMTNFRGRCAIFVIWLVGVLAIGLEIAFGLIKRKDNKSFCEAIAYGDRNSEVIICFFVFVCLFVIIAIYSIIYFSVAKGKSSNRGISHQRKGSHYLKTLVTTSFFVLTFILFWTPIGIFNVYMHFISETYFMNNWERFVKIGEILYVVLLLNTVADPVIYVLRLRQVRRQCFKQDSRGLSRRSTKSKSAYGEGTEKCDH